jgi:hypothetical protein
VTAVESGYLEGEVGYSGPVTSKKRAEYLWESGVYATLADLCEAYINSYGYEGRTIAEAVAWYNDLTGGDNWKSIGPAFTTLLRVERIARVDEERAGGQVHVGLAYVDGRTEIPYESNNEKLKAKHAVQIALLNEEIDALKAKLVETHETMSMVWNYLDKFFPGWKEKVRGWNNAGRP